MSVPTITLSAAEAVERVAAAFSPETGEQPRIWVVSPQERAGIYAALASGGTFVLGKTANPDESCLCPARAAGINEGRSSGIGCTIDRAFGVTPGILTTLTVTV